LFTFGLPDSTLTLFTFGGVFYHSSSFTFGLPDSTLALFTFGGVFYIRPCARFTCLIQHAPCSCLACLIRHPTFFTFGTPDQEIPTPRSLLIDARAQRAPY
jgi:hypothetical protein